MGELIKMVVVLSAICGISGFVLSNLKEYTAPLIEMQVLTYEQKPALDRIFGEAENDPVADRRRFEIPGRDAPVTVFPIMKDGKLAAVALEGFGKGYGGDVSIMVGIDPRRDTLIGISPAKMQETPGIGSRVAEPKFTGQYAGVNFQDARSRADGGKIDAVSGATVSSGAVFEAVKNVLADYAAIKSDIFKTWKSGE